MTREVFLKNLEIVFYARDGQNGSPSEVHKILASVPHDTIPKDRDDVWSLAKYLQKTKYFSTESEEDLAIEITRAYYISQQETNGKDFELAEVI